MNKLLILLVMLPIFCYGQKHNFATDQIRVEYVTVDSLVADSADVDSADIEWADIAELTDGTATLQNGNFTGLNNVALDSLNTDSIDAEWANIIKLTDGTATLESGNFTGLNNVALDSLDADSADIEWANIAQLTDGVATLQNGNLTGLNNVVLDSLDADSIDVEWGNVATLESDSIYTTKLLSGYWRQDRMTWILGEAFSTAPTLAFIDGDDATDRLFKFDADSSRHPNWGIVVVEDTGSIGSTVDIILQGYVPGLSGLDKGKKAWGSRTSGSITTSPDTNFTLQPVGHALSTTELWFNPSGNWSVK